MPDEFGAPTTRRRRLPLASLAKKRKRLKYPLHEEPAFRT
jgi:hypothetical protein